MIVAWSGMLDSAQGRCTLASAEVSSFGPGLLFWSTLLSLALLVRGYLYSLCGRNTWSFPPLWLSFALFPKSYNRSVSQQVIVLEHKF